MAAEQHKPRLIAFEVTRRCRYACRHCRANAYSDADEEELTTEQCRKVLAAVGDFVSASAQARRLPPQKQQCTIILMGGEPMERGDICELIAYGRQQGLRMVMATCGYLIDDDSIAELKEAGIEALSLYLDSCSAQVHDTLRRAAGAFDAAVTAAAYAKRAGVPFQINTTVSKINCDEVLGIADLARNLGAYCFNACILVPTRSTAQIEDAMLDPVEYEALLGELLRIKLKGEIELTLTCAPQFSRICQQAKERHLLEDVHGCMGAREFGFISCKGDVQTCGYLDVAAGNLVENDFDFGTIWSQSQFLERIRERSEYTGGCGDCEYVGVCGGCRARALAICGDYLAGDPICSYKGEGES
jgi:radical SAM protein with 4Fe4S-binding SPASM domain